MTASSAHLDEIFKSLSDGTRRDILKRLVQSELSVTEIAAPYDLSYAAVSKHLKVLEKANLISRRRQGKTYQITTCLEPLKKVNSWIEFYRKFWDEAFDEMDDYLQGLQQTTDHPHHKENKQNE